LKLPVTGPVPPAFSALQVRRGSGAPHAPAAPCALTIGNFDGVHCGHRALLRRVVAAADARGLVPAAMTFEPHPREFFSPASAPPRVANLRDKLAGLADAGIRRVHVQRFARSLARMSPEDFIDHLLLGACQMRWLIVGDDFRFGAGRAGDLKLLRARAARHGCEVEELPAVREGTLRISSTAVRAALAEGQLATAARLLGHPYAISGRVQHGARLGRQLGWPTLNLRVAHRQPAVQGIFAVRVHGLGAPRPAVASLGQRPAVDNSGRWLLEVHVFGFDQEVYGRLVQIEFIAKLREERSFDSLDLLARAIAADAAQARQVLGGLGEDPQPQDA
jgi:riboflavin kinase/FMN adenylyltransferase